MNEERSPAHIFLSEVNSMPPHVHHATEILFILSGKCEFHDMNADYVLSDGDIVLINSNTIHSFGTDGECIHMVLQIEFSRLPFIMSGETLRFYLNSKQDPNTEKYRRIRHLLAKLVIDQHADSAGAAPFGILYGIVSELVCHFSQNTDSGVSTHLHSSKYMERLSFILQFIHQNYDKGLSLSETADAAGLSAPYFSAFFKKYMRITFIEYYNHLRLNNATKQLLRSDDSIDSIAHQNGFSDARTFVKLFKERNGMLPSVYRKSLSQSPFPEAKSRSGNMFFPSLGKSVYLPKLMPYYHDNLPALPKELPQAAPSGVRTSYGTVYANVLKPSFLQIRFQKVCHVDNPADLFVPAVRNMLETAQKDIHFTHFAFHFGQCSHLLFLHDVLDDLVRIKLPLLLFPDSLENNKVLDLLKHIVERYGMSYLSDCSIVMDCHNTELLLSVRKFYPWLRIEWMPLSILNSEEASLFAEVVGTARTRKALPDVFNITYNDRETLAFFSREPDYLIRFQKEIDSFFHANRIVHIPYQLADCFHLRHGLNPSHDTCYAANYITHLTLALTGLFPYRSFIRLTDFSSDYQFPAAPFHGGHGIFTYNGIKKPSYSAYQFMNELHAEVIGQDAGFIVTGNGAQVAAIFYDHSFFQKVMHENPRSSSPFFNDVKSYFSIKLDGLDGDEYRIMEYCLNTKKGSTSDIWTALNSPVVLTELEEAYLGSVNTLHTAHAGKIDNGIINLELELEPLEIRLIRIEIQSRMSDKGNG